MKNPIVVAIGAVTVILFAALIWTIYFPGAQQGESTPELLQTSQEVRDGVNQ
jgi:hypothetical protein